MGLRSPGGRKPTWTWNKAHGKMERDRKGKIDWYRYQIHILIPKLIPFALHCMINRPDTLIQEDKAPSHACKHQDQIFMNAGVMRLIWPGNSPDLNMIETCWAWMKRQTTRRGCPTNRIIMEKVWTRCWKKTLTQKRIQHWIERIPRHIQQVIALEGGNQYREGSTEAESGVRLYISEERKERYDRGRRGLRAGDNSNNSSDDEVDD